MSIIVYHDGIEFKIATSSEHEAENQLAALKERMIERQIKKGGKQIPFEHIGKWVSHIIESEKEEAAPKLADLLLSQAVLHNASDVHLEPGKGRLRVNYRIDGFFQTVAEIPESTHEKLVSRIKVMSRLITYERNTPQEGRLAVEVGGTERNFRVSIMPTVTGEKVVIRVFNVHQNVLSFDQLGFNPQILNTFKSLCFNPQGAILVTGPSGSGKTTTLHTVLCEIQRTKGNSVNIVSIEDPVENYLGLFAQIQVDKGRNLTFPKALSAILRQDPDVIMVGEIRDSETAQIVTQAALTGHLIFSTIHSGTVAGVFTRLLDMGLEGYLLISAITGTLAQRLVRKICDGCKEVYRPDTEILEKLCVQDEFKDIELQRGSGCQLCFHTGYKGRIPIAELLIVTDEIKDAILSKSSTPTIESLARTLGMKPLREDGLEKVRQGVTTVEELIRVL